MKYPHLYFLLAIAFIDSPLYAQPSIQSSRLWLGAHAGAQSSTFFYDPERGYMTSELKTGIVIGAEMNYWFSNNYGICGQLNYTQKGAKETSLYIGINESFEVTSVINLSYLQLPVLFKATLTEHIVNPFFIIGPEIGLRLSATESVTGDVVQDTQTDIPDSVTSFVNFGILAGAGISYALNPSMQLYMTAAYNYGLSNLNAHYGKSEDDIEDTQKVFTRDIRINLGIIVALASDKDSSPYEE
jgi:hypothetical protein